MSRPIAVRPRLLALADRLEQDIRDRGLQAGDAYLSAADAARMLQVNANLANRALQLLVQRGRLERKQRKGAFVTEPGASGRPSALGRVHLIVHQAYLKTEGLLADGTIMGLQEELPGAEVQFNFLPAVDPTDYIDDLIGQALRSSQPEGFVLVRSPLEVHQRVHASGLPVVIHGTPYPSLAGMAWVDVDHAQKGLLLTDYLLSQGIRRIAGLMRSSLMPGDHRLLDAVSGRLAEVGLLANSWRVRCQPIDERMVEATILAIASESADPLGIICRSQPLAEAVHRALKNHSGLPASEVVVCDVYDPAKKKSLPFAFTDTTQEPAEIGRHIGRLLVQQVARISDAVNYRLIPVALQRPN